MGVVQVLSSIGRFCSAPAGQRAFGHCQRGAGRFRGATDGSRPRHDARAHRIVEARSFRGGAAVRMRDRQGQQGSGCLHESGHS